MSKNNAQGRTIVGSAAYLDAPSLSLKSNLIMADSNQLKEGDVVRLKSGGPKMTVRSIEGRTAYCVWFADKDTKYADLELVTLVLESN